MVIVAIVGLAAVGFAAIYLPRLLTNRMEQFTREYFIEMHPDFVWLQSDLIFEFVWFTFLMIVIAVGIYLFQHKPVSLGLFSLFPAGLALTNGLLTARTGICRVPYRRKRYLYVYDESLRAVGWIQFSVAIVVIATAIILVLFLY